MEKSACCTCFKPKATLTCEVCLESVCKYCAQFLSEDSFAHLENKPAHLQKTTFCGPCFSNTVATDLEKYNATLARAKDILVFNKTQNKETRFVKRDEEIIHVPPCESRDEVVMRLAFRAAHANFNAVIDLNLDSKKIRTGAYQTTVWFGSGIPANVIPERLIKDRAFRSQPN